MTWLGLDIGGANLKAADENGLAAAVPFPLWKQPGQLCGALESLIRRFPHVTRLAVTMTGELADCFATKREGVEHILSAISVAARNCGELEISVYLTDGSFVSVEVARERPWEAAAANWHALARFVGRFVPVRVHSALLIDIGSTTADIIPLITGEPACQGKTDTDRLLAGELVYTGVERSPVCAVVSELPYRGRQCPVAQELFATTLDAYVMLGDLSEDASNTSTADGRPATKEAARDRLARTICADREIFDFEDARNAAHAIAAAQLERLRTAAHSVIERLPSPPGAVVVSGSGEFLARRLVDALAPHVPVISLSHAVARVGNSGENRNHSQMMPGEATSLQTASSLALRVGMRDSASIQSATSELARGASVAGGASVLSRCATAYALAVLASEQVLDGPASAPRSRSIAILHRVIKVGGSLLACQDWPQRFTAWLARQPTACNLLVVGGGNLAEAIRIADETHKLGDEAAHWLAILAMSMQAEIVPKLLPDHAGVVADLAKLQRLAEPGLWLAEPWALLQADENAPDGGTLPHSWDVTSDSIAARLAHLWGADELVLLKAGYPMGARDDADLLAQEGYVDRHFPVIAKQVRWRVERLGQ